MALVPLEAFKYFKVQQVYQNKNYQLSFTICKNSKLLPNGYINKCTVLDLDFFFLGQNKLSTRILQELLV